MNYNEAKMLYPLHSVYRDLNGRNLLIISRLADPNPILEVPVATAMVLVDLDKQVEIPWVKFEDWHQSILDKKCARVYKVERDNRLLPEDAFIMMNEGRAVMGKLMFERWDRIRDLVDRWSDFFGKLSYTSPELLEAYVMEISGQPVQKELKMEEKMPVAPPKVVQGEMELTK